MSENNRKPPSPLVRNILMWAGILLALVLMVQLFQGPSERRAGGEEIAYSEFLAKVDEGQVKEAAISGRLITGQLSNDQAFRTYNPGDMQLIERLRAKNVKFDAVPEERPSLLQQVVVGALPFLIMIGIWIFFMRQMQNGQGRGAMGFGKSRAKLLTEKHGRVTFDDVAGIDEAREELQEIVEFLTEPSRSHRRGGKSPPGALLV
ncbi:MAG: ATP-dependent metallopeptidase FtsH/Yme1/Tma family protein, partial [Sandaracinobacter sp.]